MNSLREGLFSYLAGTELIKLNGSAPFTNSIAYITREIRTYAECPERPAIVQVEGAESIERVSSIEKLFLSAGVTYYVYFDPDPDLGLSTQINSWLADLKFLMLGSATRRHGGYCTATHFKGFEPFPFPDQPVTGFAADFTFDYHHIWDDPGAAA